MYNEFFLVNNELKESEKMNESIKNLSKTKKYGRKNN